MDSNSDPLFKRAEAITAEVRRLREEHERWRAVVLREARRKRELEAKLNALIAELRVKHGSTSSN